MLLTPRLASIESRSPGACDSCRSGGNLSIPEPYAGREQYLGLFAEAAMQAVRDRFLVPEDLASVMERGAEEGEQATK